MAKMIKNEKEKLQNVMSYLPKEVINDLKEIGEQRNLTLSETIRTLMVILTENEVLNPEKFDFGILDKLKDKKEE